MRSVARCSQGRSASRTCTVAAFLVPQAGLGDDRVDLAHAGVQALDACAERAGHEPSGTVEPDVSADLATDPGVDVDVDVDGAPGFGRLQAQLVGDQRIHALAPRKAPGSQPGPGCCPGKPTCSVRVGAPLSESSSRRLPDKALQARARRGLMGSGPSRICTRVRCKVIPRARCFPPQPHCCRSMSGASRVRGRRRGWCPGAP